MHSKDSGKVLAFIETSAIINYAKADAFQEFYETRNVPKRALIIRSFIRKAREKWKLNASKKVVGQLAHSRDMIEMELMKKGIPASKILKIVEIATKAIRNFLEQDVEILEADGGELVEPVKKFFNKYKDDRRMLDAAESKKAKRGEVQSTLPEESDMGIFADALVAKSEYFITTDSHFCLEEELKDEFGIEIINHYNARIKEEKLGWF